MSHSSWNRAAHRLLIVPNMRFMVIGVAAVVGLGIGTVSAVAVAYSKPATKTNHYEVASTNIDQAQTTLSSGDVASARAHLDTAKAHTAKCDADAKCRARVDNFNLHARLDQVERRVALAKP